MRLRIKLKEGEGSLSLVRRHVTACQRFTTTAGYGPRPLKERPATPQPPDSGKGGKEGEAERKADRRCDRICPVYAYGHLWNEFDELPNGQKRFRRNSGFAMPGNPLDFATASATKLDLYKRGTFFADPAAQIRPATSKATPAEKTVEYAVERFMATRSPDGGTPMTLGTNRGYSSILNARLIPWCKDNGVKLADLKSTDKCSEFIETWRVLRGSKASIGKRLGDYTKDVRKVYLNTFLNYCVNEGWLEKNGAAAFATQLVNKNRKYGLSNDEYARLEAARWPLTHNGKHGCPQGYSDIDNQETHVAIRFLRYCGMRKADIVESISSDEIQWDGDEPKVVFIPKKTQEWDIDVEVPIPRLIYDDMITLPGKTVAGKHYFFRCGSHALYRRIKRFAEVAQGCDENGKNPTHKFAHPFSPHTLRHTFVIQHIRLGTNIYWISQAIGHRTIKTTLKEYSHWLREVKAAANREIREKNILIMDHVKSILVPEPIQAETPEEFAAKVESKRLRELAQVKSYRKTAQGKAVAEKSVTKYRTTAKGKAAIARSTKQYQATANGKAVRAKNTRIYKQRLKDKKVAAAKQTA